MDVDVVDMIDAGEEIGILLPFVDGDAFKAAAAFARKSRASKKSWADNYANHLVALLRSVPFIENGEKLQEWRNTHPEEVKEIASRSGSVNLRKWWETHPEEAREKALAASIKGLLAAHEWRKSYPEEARDVGKAIGKANVIHLRKWREANPEKAKAIAVEKLRKWRAEHPKEIITARKVAAATLRKSVPWSASGYKGVYKDRNRWRAVIWVNQRIIRLGYFATPELAAVAYNTAALKYHGPDAYQNMV